MSQSPLQFVKEAVKGKPAEAPILIEGQPVKEPDRLLNEPLSSILFYSAMVVVIVACISFFVGFSNGPLGFIHSSTAYDVSMFLGIFLFIVAGLLILLAWKRRQIEIVQEKAEADHQAALEHQRQLEIITTGKDTPPNTLQLELAKLTVEEKRVKLDAKIKQAERESNEAIEKAKLDGNYSLAALKLQAERDLYEIDKLYQDEETRRKIDAKMKQMDANMQFFHMLEELKKTNSDLAQFMYNQWTVKEK